MRDPRRELGTRRHFTIPVAVELDVELMSGRHLQWYFSEYARLARAGVRVLARERASRTAGWRT